MTKTQTLAKVLNLSSPAHIMGFSKILGSYIENNALSTVIAGKKYAMVDGWKFAGANFGLTALPDEPIPMHLAGQYLTILFHNQNIKGKDGKMYQKQVPFFGGYTTDIAIINEVKNRYDVVKEIIKPYYAYKCNTVIERLTNGRIVGRGSSICTNLETAKLEFDEYSIHSMSQTRSIGKSYRNLLGYVMKGAGMETTPAEEMDQGMFNEATVVNEKKTNSTIKPTEKQFEKLKDLVKSGKRKLEGDIFEKYDLRAEQIQELQNIKP